MKKPIIVVLTIAILGLVAAFTRHPQSSGTLVPAGNSSSTSSPDNTSSSDSSTTPATYKDGTYTGSSEDTAYGTVKIAVVISGGKITSVNFLQMPDDLGNSQQVTAMAEPLLKQTTLQKQSAHIDFVSGATQTSEGYQASLQAALDQAV